MTETTKSSSESAEPTPNFKLIPSDALAIVLGHVQDLRGIFIETGRRLDGVRWQHHIYPLTVISSVCMEADEKLWLHVSLAHTKRMPNYDEIKMVKELFIGRNKYAAMVFPPEEHFVNVHRTCLHLWHCLEGWPLPEFSGTINGKRSL